MRGSIGVARVRYDWDEHNEGHVAAHRVEPTEVEEVLANDPIHLETRTDARSGESAFSSWDTPIPAAFFLAWTPRGKLKRPVTAFDANRKTRAAYRRRRNEEKQQQYY